MVIVSLAVLVVMASDASARVGALEIPAVEADVDAVT
jgi:hypothetical protein